GVSVIIMLISIIVMMWYGPIDKNPVKFEVEGEVVSLYNRSGTKVNEHLWNEYSAFQYQYFLDINESQHLPLGLFDIFGDGQNHLVIGTVPNSQHDFSSGNIAAYHSITGEKIWEFTPHFELDYPFKPEMNKSYMIVNIFQTTINSQSKLVMIIRERNYFTSIILTADPITGKLDPDYYVHNGAIMAAHIFNHKNYENPLLAFGG